MCHLVWRAQDVTPMSTESSPFSFLLAGSWCVAHSITEHQWQTCRYLPTNANYRHSPHMREGSFSLSRKWQVKEMPQANNGTALPMSVDSLSEANFGLTARVQHVKQQVVNWHVMAMTRWGLNKVNEGLFLLISAVQDKTNLRYQRI